MAITWTVTELDKSTSGNRRIHTGVISSDASPSYTAGGDALTLKQLGLHAAKVVDLEILAPTTGSLTYLARYDIVNEKVRLYVSATDTLIELPTAQAAEIHSMHFIAIGY